MIKRTAITAAGLLAMGAIPAIAATGGQAAPAQAQPVQQGDMGRRQQAIEASLKRRIDQIEQRFTEDQSFRSKIKDKRVSLEKRLAQDYVAFLKSLESMKPEQKKEAWQSFIKAQRQKRIDFKLQVRSETRKYFEDRSAAFAGQPAK